MYVNNRMASMVYKIVLAVVCLFGLLMNTGILNGTFQPYMLLYYHNASNVLCLVFYGISIAVLATRAREMENGTGHCRPFAAHFKGGVVMGMMFALIIYIFILAMGNPMANAGVLAVLSNIILNILVPLAVLADWILFDKKGVFKPSDPYVWLSVPFVYYTLVLVAAIPQLFNVAYYDGSRYPYPFINPDIPGENLGWARVLLHVILLTAVYLVVDYGLLGLDRLLGRRAEKRAAEMEMTQSGKPASGGTRTQHSAATAVHRSAPSGNGGMAPPAKAPGATPPAGS